MNPPVPPAARPNCSIDLVCHPATPCLAPVAVRVEWVVESSHGGWALQLRYAVSGNVHRLRLPAVTASGRADGLWTHTCFEAFVSESGSAAYRELNFSPSTQWAHYRFIEERVRDQGPVEHAPLVAVHASGQNQWVMVATVAVKPQSPNVPNNLFAPTAVLETDDGQLSYWAVKHPSAQPDFHTRAGWTIPLAWSIA